MPGSKFLGSDNFRTEFIDSRIESRIHEFIPDRNNDFFPQNSRFSPSLPVQGVIEFSKIVSPTSMRKGHN